MHRQDSSDLSSLIQRKVKARVGKRDAWGNVANNVMITMMMIANAGMMMMMMMKTMMTLIATCMTVITVLL